MRHACKLLLVLTFFGIPTVWAQIPEEMEGEMTAAVLGRVPSTTHGILVTKVQDRRTRETREICVEVPRLNHALTYEHVALHRSRDEIFGNNVFTFSNDSILESLGWGLYTEADLEAYSKSLDYVLVRDLATRRRGTIGLPESVVEQTMCLHLLWRAGILVARGCFGYQYEWFIPSRMQSLFDRLQTLLVCPM